jgi:hypothetical protein
MATNPHIKRDAGLRVLAIAAALAAAAFGYWSTSTDDSPQIPAGVIDAAHEGRALDSDEVELMGNAGHTPDSKKPKLTAYVLRESYPRGGTARLVITDRASSVSVQIFRTGGENHATVPNDVMLGTPVTRPRLIGDVQGRRVVDLLLGNWPSGVYFVQLTSGDRTGYAPFVLAPRRLGEQRIAVVMPTETWQAYNFRDDDGDGHPDTWYTFRKGQTTARLDRPFLNRGVPPHWKQYDAPFVRWLAHTGRTVDYLSDAELRSVADGRELANVYSLIIFSGHHEYVTSHEYDVVTQYRDLGGHLMFLAANNFFWKIELHGTIMKRIAQWRDLGRPEAALIGVQYRANDRGGHRGPWLVRGISRTRWIFGGTELQNGDGLSIGGIEIDSTAPSSPRNLVVLAEIPDLYGPGYTGQMTYYETATGAKVFAAGAFSLAASVWEPEVDRVVANVLGRLSRR